MANYSKTVSAGTRLYYFDVYEGKNGNPYLSITEMNARTEERNCIYIHPENLRKFLRALNKVKSFIYKHEADKTKMSVNVKV